MEAVLDLVHERQVVRALADVGDEESTVIIVTHDVSAAVAVSDTIWLMGRERDAAGKVIPGARIVETIDLIECGLAWQPDIRSLPGCIELVNRIKARFHTL